MPVIQTNGLSKHYAAKGGRVHALDQLTLSVNQGEIFGYLGPNGAGKTTTIRMLLDLIRPTEGSASIFGMDVRANSVTLRRRIGYLPGELNLWDNETAADIVRYFARVRGGVDMVFVRQLAERLEFDMNRKMRTYSTGNKRKIGIILALMHKPELLILDEPTSGLDPLMQQVFIQLMQEARQNGQTVFLSSHMLSEVQAVCDRVGIIRSGKLQTVDSVTALTKVNFRWVSLTMKEAVPADLFEKVPGIEEVSVSGNSASMRLSGDIQPLLTAVGNRYLVDLRTQDPTLEEVFLTYYGDLPAVNGHSRRA
ncbi:MAG: ABC transporter ATP-binding protein [Chloroflexota bacterium]|nr:ABC transporter ATP-binding protein [Chloroflexota bacterium]